jgi:signal transduction histidine kinase
MRAVLRPFADGATYRALLFILSTVPLGALWSASLLALWTLAVSVAITPLVIPVLIGIAAFVRLAAGPEGALARGLLAARSWPPRGSSAAGGFWRRSLGPLKEAWFWKAQVYLLLRFLLGWPTALVQLTLLSTALYWIAAPVYYRWIPADEGANGIDLEIWKADTLPEALLLVPAGFLLLVLAVNLARLFAVLWRGLANALLEGIMTRVYSDAATTAAGRRRALAAHATASIGVSAVLVLVWALTSGGYFWPLWALLPLGLLLAVHGWITLLQVKPDVWPRRLGFALAVHAGISVALSVFFVLVWELTTHAYFWPVWPMLGLAVAFLVHLVVVLLTSPRQAELEQRIDVLTATRAGAVDAQEAELRRIERDLHDGAQARLVALGMNLGRAEQKLGTDPEGARALIADARRGAGEALSELRDLARGIHPPVLADRGLGAAVGALAARSPLPVGVTVVGERPPAAVESAAYFVAAEALANAGKHAGATRVDIHIARDGGELVVDVRDNGRGGADPNGAGLTGLRRRVEALDGSLLVESPPGGPTVVRAELPCAS